MKGPPIRRALESGRLLRVAFGVVLLEVAVRMGLGVAVHPFLYLLTPPVVAILGIGLLAPGIRTRVLDERRRYAVDAPAGVLPRLIAVAVVGHAFAIAVGLGLFVLLDTPVQALLYWLGVESRQPVVALAWPVVGTLTGTGLAWTLPTLVAAGVSEGLGLRRATACALTAARERAVVPILLVHLLALLGLLLAVALGATVGLAASSTRLFFALAGSFAVLLVSIPLAVAMLADLGRVRTLTVDERTEFPSPTRLPVGRLALVVLLVGSLVTLAGAVRMTELRPTESPDPLGDDPDRMYATALENTLSGSYTAEWVTRPGTDEERTLTWQVDRADRQLHVEQTPRVTYVSTGTQTFESTSRVSDALRWALADDPGAVTSGGVHTPPNYFRWANEPTDLLPTELPHEITGWEQVRTDGDEITLELSDSQQVLAFAVPTVDQAQITSVERAQVRAVVDTGTRRLAAIDIALNATLRPDRRLTADERYTFDHGADVDRPDSIGSPSPAAYVWRLLLY